MKNLYLKLKESVFSVLPIAAIILVLALSIGKLSGTIIWQFALSTVMLIFGMGLFSLGTELALEPIGNKTGAKIVKSKNICKIIAVCFLIGILVTFAEPDLMVLAEILKDVVNNYLLITTVAIGIAIFLVLSMIRVVFQINLRTILIVSYTIVFILAIFVPKEYLAIAFDSGGVTTGPITIPFILAFGIGMASSKSDANMEDKFGWVALCAIGPILAVLILGFFADVSSLETVDFSANIFTSNNILANFGNAFPIYLKEVAVALVPMLLFVLIFNFISLKLSKRSLVKILIGLVYVYFGLVLFLTGVNQGFAPIGTELGAIIVSRGFKWLLIPIGMLIGFFIVIAEPAVHVLVDQVEEISGGTIKRKSVFISLMVGVAVAIGLSMLRIITGLSIWWFLFPGYAISIILTFVVPRLFTSIAFDSGSVASGPISAAYLIPFAVGAAIATGGNVLTDAFGLVALVSMSPFITIQVLGAITFAKSKKYQQEPTITTDCVIAFDDENFALKTTVCESAEIEAQNEIIDFDAVMEKIDDVKKPKSQNSNLMKTTLTKIKTQVMRTGKNGVEQKTHAKKSTTAESTTTKKDKDTTENE